MAEERGEHMMRSGREYTRGGRENSHGEHPDRLHRTRDMIQGKMRLGIEGLNLIPGYTDLLLAILVPLGYILSMHS